MRRHDTGAISAQERNSVQRLSRREVLLALLRIGLLLLLLSQLLELLKLLELLELLNLLKLLHLLRQLLLREHLLHGIDLERQQATELARDAADLTTQTGLAE